MHPLKPVLVNWWRSFIKNGDPSVEGYPWYEFDGFEQHMEIENDENGPVVRK